MLSKSKKLSTFSKNKKLSMFSKNKKLSMLPKRKTTSNRIRTLDRKSKTKTNQPIFIFNYNYDNNYYKYKNNKTFNSSKKEITMKSQNSKLIKKIKIKTTKLNKEKKFPGYYNLIKQMQIIP